MLILVPPTPFLLIAKSDELNETFFVVYLNRLHADEVFWRRLAYKSPPEPSHRVENERGVSK